MFAIKSRNSVLDSLKLSRKFLRVSVTQSSNLQWMKSLIFYSGNDRIHLDVSCYEMDNFAPSKLSTDFCWK